jgi:lysophospholipase L1-like esterase
MTVLALGCSHTAGIGVNAEDCYVSVLAQMLNQTIDNQSEPGGNHTVIQQRLAKAFVQTVLPDLVIAQWPNPFRRRTWRDGRPHNENINTTSAAFDQLLRQSQQNFIEPWIDTIVICNLLCKAADVPVINIMIENIAPEYHTVLAQYGIQLHVDQKTPDQTWLMDSAAADNMHHSAKCHKQWAERLYGLLNEHTTR